MQTNQSNNEVRPAPRSWHLIAAALGITAVLVACGGGGGGGSTASVGSGGTGFSGPISGFGSIIVNGVRLDDSGAAVTLDDDVSGSSGDLRLGMMVDIEGSRSADGVTGKASTIGSHSVVQGPVTSVTATQLTVLGLTVTVTPSTALSGIANLAALLPGDVVEIHGIPNGADGLTATRIESKSSAEVRLTGAVANITSTTFTLHGTLVNFAGLSGSNLPASLANNMVVRVRGALATGPLAIPATINATRVRARNLDHLKKNGQLLEIEGIVTAFTSASNFVVNGLQVTVASNATVEGGPVVLGSRVEVNGTVDASGNLVVSKVEVKNDAVEGEQANELHGSITAVDALAKTFTLRGVTVAWDNNTTFTRLNASGLAVNVKVEVKGKVTGNVVLASSIKLED